MSVKVQRAKSVEQWDLAPSNSRWLVLNLDTIVDPWDYFAISRDYPASSGATLLERNEDTLLEAMRDFANKNKVVYPPTKFFLDKFGEPWVIAKASYDTPLERYIAATAAYNGVLIDSGDNKSLLGTDWMTIDSVKNLIRDFVATVTSPTDPTDDGSLEGYDKKAALAQIPAGPPSPPKPPTLPSGESTSPTTIPTTDQAPADPELAFYKKLGDVATELGFQAPDLLLVLWAESRLNPKNGAKSKDGSFVARGLNQLTLTGAKGIGMTEAEWIALSDKTAIEQLDTVKRFFAKNKRPGSAQSAVTIHQTNFAPATVGTGVLYSAPSREYADNSLVDYDKDGRITTTDLRTFLKRAEADNFKPRLDMLAKAGFPGAPGFDAPAPPRAANLASGGGGGLVLAAAGAGLLYWLWKR